VTDNPGSRHPPGGQNRPRRAVARLRQRARFSISALIFLILAVALIAGGMSYALALLLAFDIATAIFLATTIHMFARSKTSSMRARARRQDEGYWGFLLSSVAVAIIALVALALELHASKTGGLLEITLAGCTLLLAWLFMNTIFALHYAHEFYGDLGQKASGLQFPGTREPDYWDFVYFAFVIGMTFQVSDVQISERGIRRVALVHGVVAFFFDVIIIALTVNLIAGKA
jgi:uncharacterized membrane protein